MVKVLGPAMSMEASGQLGGVLVFSRWKGRPYARSLVKPSNPKTPAQVGIRAMLRFLSQAWTDLSDPNQSSFDDLAKNTNISPFNAYIAYNVRRWRENRNPTQDYPAAEASTPLTITMALNGGQRNVLVSLTPSGSTDIWGLAIFRSLAAITDINWNLCIAVIPADGGNEVLYTDAPLDAETYHYRACAIMLDGKTTIGAADDDATVT